MRPTKLIKIKCITHINCTRHSSSAYNKQKLKKPRICLIRFSHHIYRILLFVDPNFMMSPKIIFSKNSPSSTINKHVKYEISILQNIIVSVILKRCKNLNLIS